MSKLKDIASKYVLNTRIELNDDDYLILRELTEKEMFSFDQENGKANMDLLSKILPECIIEHSFENEDGEKASTKDVVKELQKSGSTYISIVEKWMQSLPLANKSGGK